MGEPATPHSGSREVRAFLLSFLSCRVGWLCSPSLETIEGADETRPQMRTSKQWTHVVLICGPGIAGAVAGVSAAIALKTSGPDCRVTCLVSGDVAPLLERQPAVDQAIGDFVVGELMTFLRQQSPSLVLLLTFSPSGFLGAMLARIPVRMCCTSVAGIGRMGRILACFFGCQEGRVETTVLKALRIMGLPSRLPARPWVCLTPRERRRARRCVRSLPRPRVLVHPSCLSGAMGLLNSQWSLVLAGYDGAFCKHPSLPQWLERGALDLLSKLSLREWLAVLVETDVLVSADEESLFLADVMGVPTVRVTPSFRNNDIRSVLPEAVVWQVEAVLRHRVRIIGRADVHHAGVF